MDYNADVVVEETVHQDAGRIVGVDYIYTENRPEGGRRHYHVAIQRQHYERLAARTMKTTIRFDHFIKVLRVFMMGHYASEDIPEAFRLLDTDYSCTIDMNELAAFLRVIEPDANPHLLRHHIQKADRNGTSKLNLAEFTDLVNQGIGRDIALGRL